MERTIMARAKTLCVICKKPAVAKKSAFEDATHFKCQECGEFRASGTFMMEARRLPLAARRQSLQSAVTRASYGILPMVTTYDVP
jgi:hypothetical protein